MSRRNSLEMEQESVIKTDIPPIPVDADSLEGTVRVLKAGLVQYAPFLKQWGLHNLPHWIKEQEDKLDRNSGRDPDERGGELLVSQEQATETEAVETDPGNQSFQLGENE